MADESLFPEQHSRRYEIIPEGAKWKLKLDGE